jgi:hypothetical protein
MTKRKRTTNKNKQTNKQTIKQTNNNLQDKFLTKQNISDSATREKQEDTISPGYR